ncbi:TPA: hypothetical protein ACTW89_001074 [Raoultella ornithinolytica]|jgi:hypothetical protein|uniref:hypothetical protein n=1 Tax=Raoultella TaxID=160674 RepID=UPI000DEA71D6|nr:MULTISPECIES: hypothetical protein [Raoultella]AXC31081.1 hypothetical protein DSD31_17190 [Raoultella sp. X13]EJD6654024.1 hypothetical protein [Raoultella ornithinolytica]ELV3659722.1 hypothetical protein [Raoultella ornithinolytica]MCF6652095.1 hypothetical protein [Raoultella ornithinolytica]MCF6703011.1 hypothetical protein [Raoultella ornithinolytica]
MNKVGLMIAALIISGCTVKPEVTYKKIDSSNPPIDTTLTDSFYLASSIIEIQPTTEKIKLNDGKDTSVSKYKVIVTQTDYPDFKVGIISNDGFFTKTRVSISKIDNTDRVKEIGLETTDNRVQTIKDISSVVVALVPFVGLMSNDNKSSTYTNKISVAEMIEHFKNTTESSSIIVLDKITKATIKLGKQPLDSIPIDEFSKPDVRDSLKNSFIYSSCTNIDIEVETKRKDGEPIKQEFTTRVSDPRYIQYVAFPYKGKIITHDQCGVSVTTETSNPSSDAAVIAALLTEVKNIKTEIDKNKKNP